MPDPKKYPKCKYHAVQPACVVADEKEEAALGEGWFDHPDLVTTCPVCGQVGLSAISLAKHEIEHRKAKVKSIKADDSK